MEQSQLNQVLTGRIYVFIDASNVFFIKKRLRVEIDYAKVLQFFRSFDKDSKFYFFSAFQEDYQKQIDYLNELSQLGFIVRKKPLKFISSPKSKGTKSKDSKDEGFYKGNMDVELAIDAIRMMSQYDTFVLFSGDSDFFTLLKYLQEHDKKIVVLSTRGFVAEELTTIGHFIDIADYLQKPKSPRRQNNTQQKRRRAPQAKKLPQLRT